MTTTTRTLTPEEVWPRIDGVLRAWGHRRTHELRARFLAGAAEHGDDWSLWAETRFAKEIREELADTSLLSAMRVVARDLRHAGINITPSDSALENTAAIERLTDALAAARHGHIADVLVETADLERLLAHITPDAAPRELPGDITDVAYKAARAATRADLTEDRL